MSQTCLAAANPSVDRYSLQNLNRCVQQDARSAEPALDRDALYAELQPLVRRLIRQYGDTPELRNELVGEIYYRFCTLLEAYDPDRGIPLRPYLIRQLTASVYSYARSGWRQRERQVSMDSLDEKYDWEPAEDPTQSWDAKLDAQRMRASLPDAIAKLSKRQRQVLIWRYFEDRSFEEIAERLQIEEATVRSLLRHAINKLRTIIAKEQ